MSSERTTHNPSTQAVKVRPSPDLFQVVQMDGTTGLEALPVYYGHDFPSDELIGPFLTRGACDWCLACINNVRESQKVRTGRN